MRRLNPAIIDIGEVDSLAQGATVFRRKVWTPPGGKTCFGDTLEAHARNLLVAYKLDFGHSCGVAERIGPGRWQTEAEFCSGGVGAVMLPKSARARSYSARRPERRGRSGAVWGTTRSP